MRRLETYKVDVIALRGSIVFYLQARSAEAASKEAVTKAGIRGLDVGKDTRVFVDDIQMERK